MLVVGFLFLVTRRQPAAKASLCKQQRNSMAVFVVNGKMVAYI
jgi:hypothetical protein